ncbi:MAG TPA: hypothetical protein VGN88_10300, partial [Phycisphaerae bacterium]
MRYLFMVVATALFAFALWLVYRKVKSDTRKIPPLSTLKPHITDEAEDDPDAGTPQIMPAPPNSLVLLQRKEYVLSREMVARAIQRATGLSVAEFDSTSSNPPAARWAAPPMDAICPFMIRGMLFTLTSIQSPYEKDRDWYVEDETPPELLSAWQRHRAWLSIDGVAMESAQGDDEDPLRILGRLAAELADDFTLAVLRPSHRHAVAFDPEVRTMLR